MINLRQSVVLAVVAALAFAGWEAIGHWFLMDLPMGVRHAASATIATLLALLLVAAVARIIVSQHRQLQKLARLRDYLSQMEAHYLRLPASELADPAQHFESQRRRARFVDLQQSLASRSPVVRARAYRDIATLAIDSAAEPEEARSLLLRGCGHLAAALYLERDSLARSEALQTIQTLADYAIPRGVDVISTFVNELAHANRAAFKQLQEEVAKWHLTTDHLDAATAGAGRLRSLSRITRLADTEDAGIDLMSEILESEEVVRITAAGKAASGTKAPSTIDRDQLSELLTAASCLQDSCIALSHLIRSISPPTELALIEANSDSRLPGHKLSLDGCFLAYADLQESHLEGVSMAQAWLQGVNLSGAHLMRAVFTDAHMRSAHLYSADLRWARLRGAHLTDAGLSDARLEGADLSRADLTGAYLIGARLRDAVLWKTTMQSEVRDDNRKADFTRANWWDASICDPMTGSADKTVLAWLSALFPQGDSAQRAPSNTSA